MKSAYSPCNGDPAPNGQEGRREGVACLGNITARAVCDRRKSWSLLNKVPLYSHIVEPYL